MEGVVGVVSDRVERARECEAVGPTGEGVRPQAELRRG